MSLVLLSDDSPVRQARTGLVRPDGRAVRDDQGRAHFMGVTMFWAPYGWKFERERTMANIDFLASKGADYLRMLGEVLDWEDRPIDPDWPDYVENLAGVVDYAYSRGVRTQLTVIGGGTTKHLDVCDKVILALRDRAHKVAYIEAVNEWQRLDKADVPTMQAMVRRLKAGLPNMLALSQPRSSSEEHGGGTWAEMKEFMKACGANVFVEHTDRSSGDANWRMVRQAYDFINANPYTGSNQEGPGPASSVNVLDHPLQLALYRYLSHMTGCGFFTLHIGTGVTGLLDVKRGRPANFWEVENIDEIFGAVRGVDQWLPEDVQNWRVVNNGRSNHPLPLDGKVGVGFWEGSKPGSVNKNYASLGPDGRFCEVLLGVNNAVDGGLTLVGTARQACDVVAVDPVTGSVVDERRLNAGQAWHLPGRRDKLAGYIVVGKLKQL